MIKKNKRHLDDVFLHSLATARALTTYPSNNWMDYYVLRDVLDEAIECGVIIDRGLVYSDDFILQMVLALLHPNVSPVLLTQPHLHWNVAAYLAKARGCSVTFVDNRALSEFETCIRPIKQLPKFDYGVILLKDLPKVQTYEVIVASMPELVSDAKLLGKLFNVLNYGGVLCITDAGTHPFSMDETIETTDVEKAIAGLKTNSFYLPFGPGYHIIAKP